MQSASWDVFFPSVPAVDAGVEGRVLPTISLEKRHDGQAACEPGGGGCGGVPVHHPRLHTHRTSPAQALLTILAETCCNV
jgi:hypothetical protein